MNYDVGEALKFRKSAWNNKKYNLDTPIYILEDALMEDRLKKDLNEEFGIQKVTKKFELAKKDRRHLQDIIDYLNKVNNSDMEEEDL